MSDIWNISLQDLSRFGEISEHWSPDYAFCIMHVRLCICQRESDESTKEKSCTMYVPTEKSASIKVQKAKKWTVHCATNKQAVECCAVCIVRIAMSVVWPPSLEVGSSHLWCGLIAKLEIAKLESRLQGFATIPPRHWLHHPWERERALLQSLSKFPPR